LDGDFSRNSFPTPDCIQTPFRYLNDSIRFCRYCGDAEGYNFYSNSSVPRKVRAVQRLKDLAERAAAQSAHELIILRHEQFLSGIGVGTSSASRRAAMACGRLALGGAFECVDFWRSWLSVRKSINQSIGCDRRPDPRNKMPGGGACRWRGRTASKLVTHK
jgi:hypothetical protein